MHISKTVAIIVVVLATVFLIGVGILVGARIVSNGPSTSDASLSPYSAVYLSTGDVYFGILDWSPSPHMEDAWFLEHTTNAAGQSAIGVYPLSQVAWGPTGTVYFNAQDIVFWTRLSSTSSVAQLMANPSAAAQGAVPVLQTTPSSTATSTMVTTSSATTSTHSK